MPHLTDDLITSTSKLYYLLVTLAVVYAVIAIDKIEHRKTLENLATLDKALAIRYMESPPFGYQPFKAANLPDHFYGARQEAYAKTSDDSSPFTIEVQSSRGFDDSVIAGARLVEDVPMRMYAGGRCPLLATKLKPGHTFSVFTVQIVSKIYRINSENTELISFGRCSQSYPAELNVVLFRDTDGEFVVAVPALFESKLPGLGKLFAISSPKFNEMAAVKSHLPSNIAKYASLDEPYVVLNARALEFYLLRYATERSGRYYGPEKIEDAVSDVYQEKEKVSTFLGVNAANTQIIRWGLLVFFVVAWELLRRLKRLNLDDLGSDKFWFLSDVGDWPGTIFAYAYSAIPILIGLAVGLLFAAAEGHALIVLGREISVDSVLALSLPKADSRGSVDFLSTLLLVPFVLLIGVLFQISFRMLACVQRQRQKSRSKKEPLVIFHD